MSVYVELVIFNNLAIDLLIIVCVQTIRRKKIYKIRTLLSAILGAIVATIYAIVPTWAQIVIKVLLAPLMVMVFDKHSIRAGKKAIKEYFASLALFMLLTYLLGGLTYAISFAFDIDVNSYPQLGMCALSIIMLLILSRYIVSKRAQCNISTCDVILHIDNKRIKVKALCDSGNSLTDSVSGLPIFIMSKGVEEMMLRCDIQGYVNVSSVGDDKSMPIVYFDNIEVNDKTMKAYGALSRKEFDGVDIILQNSMF